MLDRFSGSMITVAVAVAAASAVISAPIARTQAQSLAASAPAPVLKTPWGEPDLQGIWMEETDTPLQRPARYAEPGIFYRGAAGRIGCGAGGAGRQGPACGARDRTRRRRLLQPAVRTQEAHRHAHVDDCRSAQWPDSANDGRGSETGRRRTGISPRFVAIDRELARTGYRTCAGGKYDPTPSPRRAELAPRYNTAGMNRHDGPEDVGVRGSLLARRAARVCKHQLPADRADTGRHLDVR